MMRKGWLAAFVLVISGCTAIAGLDRFHPRDEGMDGDVQGDGGPRRDGGDGGDVDAGDREDGGLRDGGPADSGAECVPACGEGRGCCDGVCRTIDIPARCGTCSNVCPDPANADGTCVDLACDFTCRAGFEDCNGDPGDGCEANLRSVASCGECGVVCEGAELCLVEAGGTRCGLDCASGTTQCGDSCVDLQTDELHCGSCTTACVVPANGSVQCIAGACVPTCDGGFGDCNGDALLATGDGCETDVDANVASCGGCTTVCSVRANATRACVAGLCEYMCEAGFADCNGAPADGCEANLSEPASCGSCSLQCVAPTPLCDTSAGASCLDDCAGSTVLCGTSCADLNSSTSHCGGCDQACPSRANASRTCSGGTCGFSCSPLFGDCDGNADSGCEASLAANVDRCGSCSNVCPARANATRTCSTGVCGFACNVGFADCDGDPANGCEVNVQTDTQACGACGTVCPARANATRTCAMGMCGFTCTGSFADCDGSAANGCESDLSTSVDRCGTCANVCPSAAGASRACVAGGCQIACTAGRGDCNGDLSTAPAGDGCEVVFATNPSHCGGCGNACSVAMGTATCSSGTCAIGMCTPGFADCENGYSDGCESHLLSDLEDCGACDIVCPTRTNAVRTCTGVCGFTCNGGYADCNTIASDGCEVHTQTDPANCSGCGVSCPARTNATRVCSGGTCGYVCDSSFGDCDLNPTNGCEIQTTNNTSHCGGCGNACPVPPSSSATCSGGTCGYSCLAGRADCDLAAGNGCEADTQNGVDTCGGCGTVCPARANAMRRCTGGVCGFACDSGYADCNTTPGDGCEVHTQTDPAHCSGCGVSCPVRTNATRVCSGGACGYVCNMGFGDCDLNPTNGCEITTTSNVSHCGMCGNVCPVRANATESCSAGACGYTCLMGYADCDMAAGNGCEADTQTGVDSCGACGIICPIPPNSAPRCTAESCGFVCTPGFADCDGSAINGCELDVTSDPLNCGACGNVCPTGECALGVCRFADIIHYEIEEGAGTTITNYAPGQPNGTITGPGSSFQWRTPGHATGSEAFRLALPSSGSNVSVNPNRSASSHGSVTIDLWWRYQGGPSSSASYLWRDGTGASTDFRGLVENPFFGSTIIAMRAIPGYSGELRRTSGVTDGQWHHIALVLDASTGSSRFYWDGTLTDSGPYSGSIMLSSNFRVIGANVSSSNQIAQDFDRFRVWGRAFTPAEITELWCQQRSNAAVINVSPATGSNTNTLRPTLIATFNHPVRTNVGVVTLTGSMGTSRTYNLATSPPEVSFPTSTQMRIRPGYLPSGEVITVSWSGLEVQTCGFVIAPPSPAWQVTITGCVPGVDNVVGTTVTTIPTGIPSFTEHYVASDTSSAGWVYVGGLSTLYRVRKDGSVTENLSTGGPLLTGTHLGYNMLVNGTNHYAINEIAGTAGMLWRFTQDTGSTWLSPLQDYADAATVPSGEFRAAAPLVPTLTSGPTTPIHMVTHSASGVPTEFWSVVGNSSTTPQTATLTTTATGATLASCSGLVVDSASYYTACSTGGLIRVDRTTGAVTTVPGSFGLSGVHNALHGQDLDADGLVDVLYLSTLNPNVRYICHPDAPTPVTGTLATWAGSVNSYGMGFDRVSRTLWVWNDATFELLSIR